ncbi:hypothetical protein [Polaribacter sp. SA4-12]|uniref:hypothetical protein n=1 Tax=Polaribacter sp. SA4-12 TaxID=1312072 RepID=UPI000B3CDDE7|nr:hypothetical protein [Polaribacter sp. SA4-12]ARV14762.1 hypothetical protein BTO07_06190 [Polaribacter sp. SA4-12]
MEYRNDFIEREIQKITLFLRNFIAKITGEGNVSYSLQSFDKELKGKLDFGFYEILALNEEDLKKKINGVDVLILEELLKVFYKIDIEEIGSLESNNLKRVSLIIIDEIENKSLVFSFERQQIKNYFKSEKKRN